MPNYSIYTTPKSQDNFLKNEEIPENQKAKVLDVDFG